MNSEMREREREKCVGFYIGGGWIWRDVVDDLENFMLET